MPACAGRATTAWTWARAFKVHIEKGRGAFGDHAKPFEAWLAVRDGETGWAMKDVEDAVLSRVTALLTMGMSVREIAEEIGATKSSVHRMKQRIERERKEREGGGEEGGGEGGPVSAKASTGSVPVRRSFSEGG